MPRSPSDPTGSAGMWQVVESRDRGISGMPRQRITPTRILGIRVLGMSPFSDQGRRQNQNSLKWPFARTPYLGTIERVLAYTPDKWFSRRASRDGQIDTPHQSWP